MLHANLLPRVIPVLLLVPGMLFAASGVGKVRQAIGEVKRQKATEKSWKDLRVGASVFQKDFIRTGETSSLNIELNDGSTISFGEFSEIEMSALFEEMEKGASRTRINIFKGFVEFSVKKLMKESSFQFKTGTATASIRGTSGFIGGEDGVFYASLATGKFDIQQKDDGPVMPVVAGETMFGADSLVTMQLPSSGKHGFDRMVLKTLKENKGDINKMIQAVKAADAVYQKAAAENSVTLTSPTQVTVCADGFVVEGSYITTDPKATLVLSVGDNYVSENLIRVTDGKSHKFSRRVLMNDANKLWDATSATLSFKSAVVSDEKVIELNVNKTCPEVNRVSPAVKFLSYDSIGCKMHVSVENMQDDAGILTMMEDGVSTAEEAISKNEQKRYKLSKGVHEYRVSIKDQAGNESSFDKKLGCYPVKRFNIDVYGKAKESLAVPPPPKGVQDHIGKTLQFKVKSPENDPVFLYKVTIKQNGKIILQETLGQIQSLDYQVPVELKRSASNKFDIEVIHKSGFTARATKVFEVH